MQITALATDYDGTLAHDGAVSAEALQALDRWKAAGRALLLVTGRELSELERVFPELGRFDLVVAENGAVLFDPAKGRKEMLAPPPCAPLLERLRARGVQPLRAGDAIIALWRPHETETLEAIRELGLELNVIFNKEAVMVLPSGINKATGLAAALAQLRISPHNTAGVGDAENDHAFLDRCGLAAAVGNAIPALKERADLTTAGERGDGVRELIDTLLAGAAPAARRRRIQLGWAGEEAIALEDPGAPVLICGSSGGGKSTLIMGLLSQMVALGYQTCVVDPEGDYSGAPGLLQIGTGAEAPTPAHVLQAMEDPAVSVVANLLAVPLDGRTAWLEELLAGVRPMRATAGRPHWVIIDETHHMLNQEWTGGEEPPGLTNCILATVEPAHVSPRVLREVGTALAVGEEPAAMLHQFAREAGREAPAVCGESLEPGEALAWLREGDRVIPGLRTVRSRTDRLRHRRKYAEGCMHHHAFVFRGPEDGREDRADNLQEFVRLAGEVAEATWLFHLRAGDYESWFRTSVKDEELASIAAEARGLDAGESRERLRAAIEERYTAPA